MLRKHIDNPDQLVPKMVVDSVKLQIVAEPVRSIDLKRTSYYICLLLAVAATCALSSLGPIRMQP